MASPTDRLPENTPGSLYVDSQCIDCDVCREIARAHFKRAADPGYSYVYRQPETPAQLRDVKEAIEECPVEAIGLDPDAPRD